PTYLNRTKNPQNEILENDQQRRTQSKSQVDADEFAHLEIAAFYFVPFGEVLQPVATGDLHCLRTQKSEHVKTNCNDIAVFGIFEIDIPADFALLRSFL